MSKKTRSKRAREKNEEKSIEYQKLKQEIEYFNTLRQTLSAGIAIMGVPIVAKTITELLATNKEWFYSSQGVDILSFLMASTIMPVGDNDEQLRTNVGKEDFTSHCLKMMPESATNEQKDLHMTIVNTYVDLISKNGFIWKEEKLQTIEEVKLQKEGK